MNNFVLSAFADEIDPDLLTQIRILKENDIHYLELRGIDGKNVADFSLEYTKSVKRILDINGVKVSAIGSPIGKIGILDDFDKEVERFLHILKIAEILDTNYIRIFSFYIPNGENPDNFKDEVLSRLRMFLDIVRDTPFILLHENEKGIYGDNATRCHEIMKNLHCDKFKTTFDPANFIQCEVEPYPYAYNLLKPYIEYVHIKDAEMLTGNCQPSGYGDGRIKDMLIDLKEDNYYGFLSIEPHLGTFAGYDQLELSPTLSELPSGGPKSFSIATTALRRLLGSVGGTF